jgi:DNA-binding transcriptional LysR family regulator
MANWDDMRLFLAVARAESLSGAVPVLRMDASTLSRRISRLEANLGASLFVKSSQGYVLTDRGQRLLEEAQDVEAQMQRALDPSPASGGGLTGQIRIGAPDGCANFLLPKVCAAIQARNPGLEVQVLALPRTVNLSRREADMAITVSPTEASRLTLEKICDYQLHLAMRRDMPRPETIKDLRGLPVVGYIQDMIFDRALDYLGEIADGGVQLASNSVSVQLQMLRQTRGVGVVHDFALPSATDLHRVLTHEVSLTRAFYLVRHRSDRSSERLETFAQSLVSGVRAEVARLQSLTDAG